MDFGLNITRQHPDIMNFRSLFLQLERQTHVKEKKAMLEYGFTM